VAVDAQLGVVGEVGAELDEERAEIVVEAVEVEVVDQRGGFDQPRVRGAGAGVVAAFSAHHRSLLLRPTDIQHRLGTVVLSQVGLGDVVLTLALGEADQVHAIGVDEVVDRRDERPGHRRHQRRGRERVPAMVVEERRGALRVLQPRLVHVAVHPVDRLDLEHHVPVQHVGHGAR
jgi:hypothetical protein